MNYTDIFSVSAAGMNLERTRVDVAALNLANANTVIGTSAGSYRPLRVVSVATAPSVSFANLIDASVAIPQFEVEEANVGSRLVHEPGHPLANDRGFVSYVGVDAAQEMMTLLTATRAYEANVTAMNSSRTMLLKAMDIGGGA
jgi:flagellar basal-body rod protein FlgC